MRNRFRRLGRRLARRDFLKGTVAAGGAILLGCSDGSGGMGEPDGGNGMDGGMPDKGPRCDDVFAAGTLLAPVPFVNEGTAPLDKPIGSGLDGRLHTDLRRLDRDNLITPNELFYIRTRYPDQLDPTDWRIAVSGLVNTPRQFSLDDLTPHIEPQGIHLLECSGNGAFGGFGLLSSAEWSGVSLETLLEMVDISPDATRIMMVGFDQYSQPSQNSVPGASWIFTFDQLFDAKAFIATEMNGEPLPPDHGEPVRLFVPNWYGCTCVKWLNEIVLVDENEPSTAHMQEFAFRTHQNGVPTMARDFIPATMDQTAMPTRVEKWEVGGELLYKVTGIMWGGYEVTDALEIRFNANETFEPVDVCPAQTTNCTWTLWEHVWVPTETGMHTIELRVADPDIPTRRLDTGFYLRSVEVDEV